MKITMLGCGGSQGVPTAAGDWGECDPANPLNVRSRVSVLIETTTPVGEPRTLLIDTSPDMRDQMCRTQVHALDAVLFTHAHADHLHGIDDLRSFNRRMGRPIPIFGTAATLDDIQRRFGYTIQPLNGSVYYRPALVPRLFDGPFEAQGVAVVPFEQDHGYTVSTGFRIGDFAYSTDVVRMPEAAFEALAGVKVWIVDCLRVQPHPTHSHVERTLEWIARVKPHQAILTHMDISTDYAALTRLLPPGVLPGHDGLVIEL